MALVTYMPLGMLGQAMAMLSVPSCVQLQTMSAVLLDNQGSCLVTQTVLILLIVELAFAFLMDQPN